jgi:hypothetical protein
VFANVPLPPLQLFKCQRHEWEHRVPQIQISGSVSS